MSELRALTKPLPFPWNLMLRPAGVARVSEQAKFCHVASGLSAGAPLARVRVAASVVGKLLQFHSYHVHSSRRLCLAFP